MANEMSAISTLASPRCLTGDLPIPDGDCSTFPTGATTVADSGTLAGSTYTPGPAIPALTESGDYCWQFCIHNANPNPDPSAFGTLCSDTLQFPFTENAQATVTGSSEASLQGSYSFPTVRSAR